MARISDFQSDDEGSIPFYCLHYGAVLITGPIGCPFKAEIRVRVPAALDKTVSIETVA